MPTDLQTLGRSLEHWQALYIIALVLAVLSTFLIILFNFHFRNTKHGLKWSNYVYLIAACLCVIATLAIITKTRAIDAEKDREIRVAKQQADIQIQQFKVTAAQSDEKAQTAKLEAEEAKLKAERVGKENSLLQIEVAKQEIENKKVTAELAAQNEKTNQFVQGLAQQQQGMARQMQGTPSLGDAQINAIAEQLKPFAGQKVEIHTTADTIVERLAEQFKRAFILAHIEISSSSIDMGRLYQGVMVGIHAVDGRPPMADALLTAIRSVGIQPHGVADPSIPAGQVAIFLGPE